MKEVVKVILVMVGRFVIEVADYVIKSKGKK
jgi:hypothetical protein